MLQLRAGALVESRHAIIRRSCGTVQTSLPSRIGEGAKFSRAYLCMGISIQNSEPIPISDVQFNFPLCKSTTI